MIVYQDILKRLAEHGWSGNRLQKERLISNGTIAQIRTGKPITTSTIDVICRLCGCQPGDLIKYVDDAGEE